MNPSFPDWRKVVSATLPLALLFPSCASDGFDPTKNMGRGDGSDEVKFIARADGPIDIGTLGALSKYIRGQRRLDRSEEQILEALVRKEIGGYRFERLRVLEQKRAATTKRHQTQRGEIASRHKAEIGRIQRSPAPAPEKTRQLQSAERGQQEETRKVDEVMKRELVLIDNEIAREKRTTYVVPVSDPRGPKGRSIVLVDANNRIKDSKIYQIDRSVVDLAKIAAREQPEVAVLSNVPPLRLPGGS